MERDEIQLSDPQHTLNALSDICVEEMVILSCLAPSHSSSYFAPRFDFTLLLQRNYHSSHSKLLFPYFPNSHVIYEGLHPIKPDRYYVVGVILAEQRSSSSKSWSGSDHSAHHDNSHQLCQRCSAKDLLHEVHRYLFVCMFLHGVWSSDRVCLCWIHRQENHIEEETI